MKFIISFMLVYVPVLVYSQLEKPHDFDSLEIYHTKKSKNFHFGLNKDVMIKTKRDKFKGTIMAIHESDLTISLRKSRESRITISFDEIRIIRPLEDYKLVRYLGLGLRIFGTHAYITTILINIVAYWDALAPERIITCVSGIFAFGFDRLGNWLWGRRFNTKRKWDIAPINV